MSVTASVPSGASAEPLLLQDGLVLLANPVELNGKVAWFPDTVRGYASVNAYLLIEGHVAMMIDTGVTAHRDAVIAQIRSALPGRVLSIAFTRIGEYAAICNATAIAEEVPVEAVYAMVPESWTWLEFRPRASRARIRYAIGRPPVSLLTSTDGGMPVGSGSRRLHAMRNPVRLLPSQWMYDDGTKTLFTGDTFSHSWRDTPDGPWVLDDAAYGVDPAAVRDHLFARCWWIPKAQRQFEIQQALADVFETFEVETIAPGYGCVIQGRAAVERHYQMVQDAIRATVKSEVSV